VRCPACGRLQERLDDADLTVRVFQICPVCGAAMDVHGLAPGTRIRCGTCGKVQPVIRAATLGPGPPAEEARAEEDTPTEREGMPTVAPARMDQSPRSAAPRPVERAAPAAAPEAPEPQARPFVERAALVNGEPILRHEVELRLSYIVDAARARMGPAAATRQGREMISRLRPQLQRKALDELVADRLVLQQAAEEGVDADPDEVEEVVRRFQLLEGRDAPASDLLDRARKQVILQRMMDRHTDPAPPAPEEVRAYYEANKDAFVEPLAVRLRAIVVYTDRTGRADERPADLILAQAREAFREDGGFADLAREYGEGPFADRGGAYRVGRREFVPVRGLAGPVRAALQGEAPARAGDLVGPVDLGAAQALVRVEACRGGQALPLDEVQDEIEQALMREQRLRDFETYLQHLREAADVRIFL